MGLLFNYSCGNITTAFLPGAYANVGGSPAVGIADGPQGINTVHTDGSGTYVLIPNVAIAINGIGMVAGAGFTVQGAFTSSPGVLLIEIGNAGVTLRVSVDGSMQLTTDIGGSNSYSSASGTFTFGNRHEVELEISSFAASNSCTVYLDGVAVAGLTGVQLSHLTGLNDGSTIHTVAMGGGISEGSATAVVMDSTYVLDTSGSAPCNGPLGPCISVVMIPNAPGQFSAWTPNGASLGWECISEVPPDNDTTFISSAVSGTQEACELSPPVPTITAVYGLSVISDQRQTQAGGGRTIALGVGNGSSTHSPSTYGTWGLGTVYKMNTTPLSSNPFNGLPWALVDLATLQVYAEVAS